MVTRMQSPTAAIDEFSLLMGPLVVISPVVVLTLKRVFASSLPILNGTTYLSGLASSIIVKYLAFPTSVPEG